jgi:RNA polymerase sigma factor (sigma-70 family)
VDVSARVDSDVVADHTRWWQDHGPAVVRYATLLVGPNDAADITAIAFGKVTQPHRVAIGDVRSYWMRAVFTVAQDQQRSRRRRQIRDLHAVLPTTTAMPDTQVDIRRAVASLSVQQRAVVYFTYWEDLDSTQIAVMLGIDAATVRRHLSRARARLRKVLE